MNHINHNELESTQAYHTQEMPVIIKDASCKYCEIPLWLEDCVVFSNEEYCEDCAEGLDHELS